MEQNKREQFIIRRIGGTTYKVKVVFNESGYETMEDTRWCDDNAQKPMSANRLSSELAQNERLYNVEATNNVHVGGKRVRGFVGIEVVNPLPY